MKRLSVVLSLVLFSCHPAPLPEVGDPEIDQLVPVVERLRSLSFTKDVAVGRVTAGEIREYLQKRIREEYSPDDLTNERRVLVLLKLLPESFPYEETVVSMMTSEIAGYYDPDAGKLFLAEHLPKAQLNEVVVHELTHALQDQHFQIGKLLKHKRGNDDANLALSALFEGEAMAVMMDFADQRTRPSGLLRQAMTEELKRNEALRSLPRFLVETMIFPYVEGERFVAEIRKRGRWAGVDGVYRNLPESSREILHPEIFAKGTRVNRSETDRPPVGFTVVASNVMGEFGVRQIFDPSVADGLESDRYWLVRNGPNGTGLIWKTAWSNDTEAKEYVRAWKLRFPLKGGCIRHEKSHVVTAIDVGEQRCGSLRF